MKEISSDAGEMIFNDHKLVCEYSQQIVFHHVLFILWYMYVFGIIISLVGIFVYVGYEVLPNLYYIRRHKLPLTLREMDYMHYIRSNDYSKYHQIRQLIAERVCQNKNSESLMEARKINSHTVKLQRQDSLDEFGKPYIT